MPGWKDVVKSVLQWYISIFVFMHGGRAEDGKSICAKGTVSGKDEVRML